MDIKIKCPQCGQGYEVDETTKGQTAQCEKCNAMFEIALIPAAKNQNLQICPDCGREVSKRAETCPHCGAPLGEKAPAAQPQPPPMPTGRIKVDTGENVLNRNRGCADLLIYGPLVLIVVVILGVFGKSC